MRHLQRERKVNVYERGKEEEEGEEGRKLEGWFHAHYSCQNSQYYCSYGHYRQTWYMYIHVGWH